MCLKTACLPPGQNTPSGSVDSIPSLSELGAVPKGMATHQVGSVGVDNVALQDDVGGIVRSGPTAFRNR